jgi:hypothetical protein
MSEVPVYCREWGLPYAEAQRLGMLETLELNNARPEPFESVTCSNLTEAHSDRL